MSAKRCGALTLQGSCCLSTSLVDGRHCYQHARRTLARARTTSANGGRGGASAGKVLAPLDADLGTAAGRWRWLHHAAQVVAGKRASLEQAKTIAILVRTAREEKERHPSDLPNVVIMLPDNGRDPPPAALHAPDFNGLPKEDNQ